MPTPEGQPLRPAPRLSAACFMLGAVFLVIGWVLAAQAAHQFVDFFYRPGVLATTHCFVLGWVNLVMMGVLYQYVPALTKNPIAFRAFSPVVLAVYVAGVSGLVASFWFTSLVGTAVSALSILFAVTTFSLQLATPLVRAQRWEATTIGVLLALAALAVTAMLGCWFALDKLLPLWPWPGLMKLAAHAHLGALGWITVMICALSYRMIAPIVLTTATFTRQTLWQLGLLAACSGGLAVGLLRGTTQVRLVFLAILGSLGWYAWLIARMVRKRQRALDWTMYFVFAAFGHLSLALSCAACLLWWSDRSARQTSALLVAYGMSLLLGWTSNFIVGIGNRMLPGLMAAGGAQLLPPTLALATFVFLNGGILGAVVSALALSPGTFALFTYSGLAGAVCFAAALFYRARLVSWRKA